MLLDVTAQELTGVFAEFEFVVPGDRIWSVRSVVAVVTRDVGGAPDRAYSLGVTDGTSQVSLSPAVDAGDEPGQCTITWTASQPAAVSVGAVGIVVAPLPALVLKPGYVITGTIIDGAPADSWVSALVWYTYVHSGGN